MTSLAQRLILHFEAQGTLDPATIEYLTAYEDISIEAQDLVDLSLVETKKAANALIKRLSAQISPQVTPAIPSTPTLPSTPTPPSTTITPTPSACSVEEVIEGTYDPDPKVRRAFLRDMCPCHVKRDVDLLWTRIMEMSTDVNPAVRYQVMHNLCDGSPSWREEEVIRTLEQMHNDPDKKVRRRVHQVLTSYRKTGRWNIL